MTRKLGPVVLAIGLLLVIGACAPADDETSPSPTPMPSLTPLPAVALPPTWTPTPVPPTPTPPTRTPNPSFTPRPSASPTPGVTPGAAWDVADRLVITVLQDMLNTAIINAYYAQPPDSPSAPPLITLEYGSRVGIEMAFHNDFLQEDSRVTTLAQLEVTDGVIALVEIPDARTSEGALVSEQAIRTGLALIETGINGAVMDLIPAEVSGLRWQAVQVYPGYLEAVLTPG